MIVLYAGMYAMHMQGFCVGQTALDFDTIGIIFPLEIGISAIIMAHPIYIIHQLEHNMGAHNKYCRDG